MGIVASGGKGGNKGKSRDKGRSKGQRISGWFERAAALMVCVEDDDMESAKAFAQSFAGQNIEDGMERHRQRFPNGSADLGAR